MSPVFFTVAASLRQFVGLVSGLIVLRWIQPQDLGVWQALLLVQTYLGLVRLGVVNGMNRELAFELGRGDRAKAVKLARCAQAHTLFCCAAAVAAGLIAVALRWDLGASWRAALVTFLLVTPLDFYYGYLEGTLRTTQDFTKLAWLHIAIAIVTLCSILFVALWGFHGYCVRIVALSLVPVTVLFPLRPFKEPPGIDRMIYGVLLRTGLPLYGQNYLHQVADSLDRLILLKQTNVATLGLYAPAIAVAHGVRVLADSISTYLSPRLAFLLGQTGDRRALRAPTMQAMKLGIVAALPVAFAGWFLVPPLVKAYMPRFEGSIFPMRMALLAGIALCARIGISAPTALKDWRRVFLLVAVALAAKSVLPFGGSLVWAPLEGVAIGNVAAAIVLALVTLVVARATTRSNQ